MFTSIYLSHFQITKITTKYGQGTLTRSHRFHLPSPSVSSMQHPLPFLSRPIAYISQASFPLVSPSSSADYPAFDETPKSPPWRKKLFFIVINCLTHNLNYRHWRCVLTYQSVPFFAVLFVLHERLPTWENDNRSINLLFFIFTNFTHYRSTNISFKFFLIKLFTFPIGPQFRRKDHSSPTHICVSRQTVVFSFPWVHVLFPVMTFSPEIQ